MRGLATLSFSPFKLWLRPAFVLASVRAPCGGHLLSTGCRPRLQDITRYRGFKPRERLRKIEEFLKISQESDGYGSGIRIEEFS